MTLFPGVGLPTNIMPDCKGLQGTNTPAHMESVSREEKELRHRHLVSFVWQFQGCSFKIRNLSCPCLNKLRHQWDLKISSVQLERPKSSSWKRFLPICLKWDSIDEDHPCGICYVVRVDDVVDFIVGFLFYPPRNCQWVINLIQLLAADWNPWWNLTKSYKVALKNTCKLPRGIYSITKGFMKTYLWKIS